jgi:hypothetical protein
MYFPNIQHFKRNVRLSFYAACNHTDGARIEIHANHPDDELVGICAITDTQSWDWFGYRTFLCDLNNPVGAGSLYFVFRGNSSDLLHLDWFKFC